MMLHTSSYAAGGQTHHDIHATKLAPCLDAHAQGKSPPHRLLQQQHSKARRPLFSLQPKILFDFAILRHDLGVVYVSVSMQISKQLDGGVPVVLRSKITRALGKENESRKEKNTGHDLESIRDSKGSALRITVVWVGAEQVDKAVLEQKLYQNAPSDAPLLETRRHVLDAFQLSSWSRRHSAYLMTRPRIFLGAISAYRSLAIQ